MYDLTDVKALADLALSLKLINKFNYEVDVHEFNDECLYIYIDDLPDNDEYFDIAEAYYYLKGMIASLNSITMRNV